MLSLGDVRRFFKEFELGGTSRTLNPRTVKKVEVHTMRCSDNATHNGTPVHPNRVVLSGQMRHEEAYSKSRVPSAEQPSSIFSPSQLWSPSPWASWTLPLPPAPRPPSRSPGPLPMPECAGSDAPYTQMADSSDVSCTTSRPDSGRTEQNETVHGSMLSTMSISINLMGD